jgi:adenylate cyclase
MFLSCEGTEKFTHPSERLLYDFLRGAILGFLYSLNNLFNQRFIRFADYRLRVVFMTLSQLFIFALAVVIISLLFDGAGILYFIINDLESFMEYSKLVFGFVIYFFVVIVLLIIGKEVKEIFGPGILFKILMGKYYKPREEDRYFLFIDLKSSTALTNKLGIMSYTRMLQECFKISSKIVDKFQGEIYQYVGDEVIFTWPRKKGLNNLNCYKAFPFFKKELEKHRSYFENEFNLMPEFKSSLDVGKVVVAEVGQIKKEISYIGDPLNVGSRLIGACNQFGTDFLMTKPAADELKERSAIEVNDKGSMPVKGKDEEVRLFSMNTDNFLI